MKTIEAIDFSGKRAVVRVDFNVPLDASLQVTDATRIRGAVPTIKKILGDGGSVILLSHLGRPKGGFEKKFSLENIVEKSTEIIGTEVRFSGDCISDTAYDAASKLGKGEILLMDNLRFHSEEEKGDEEFARKLSQLGDVYVNDAFGTAHRAHASTAVIAKFFAAEKKCFGYLMSEEIRSINRLIETPVTPFAAVIGGAKVSDKILLIEQLMKKVNHILIGGGMAFTFIKANGGRVGDSLCEHDKLDLARNLMKKAKEMGVKLHLPVDVIAAKEISADTQIIETDAGEIPEGWKGLDIGAATIDNFLNVVKEAKTILWNGPMGVFEIEKFQKGTKAMAEGMAMATSAGAFTLIGGGDSVSAINKFNLAEKVGYVSTGGGALLEYIEQGSLPGIEAMGRN